MTNLLLACRDKLTKNMFLLLVSFLFTFSIKGLSETMGVLTMFYNLHGVLRASNKAPGDPCLAPAILGLDYWYRSSVMSSFFYHFCLLSDSTRTKTAVS